MSGTADAGGDPASSAPARVADSRGAPDTGATSAPLAVTADVPAVPPPLLPPPPNVPPSTAAFPRTPSILPAAVPSDVASASDPAKATLSLVGTSLPLSESGSASASVVARGVYHTTPGAGAVDGKGKRGTSGTESSAGAGSGKKLPVTPAPCGTSTTMPAPLHRPGMRKDGPVDVKASVGLSSKPRPSILLTTGSTPEWFPKLVTSDPLRVRAASAGHATADGAANPVNPLPVQPKQPLVGSGVRPGTHVGDADTSLLPTSRASRGRGAGLVRRGQSATAVKRPAKHRTGAESPHQRLGVSSGNAVDTPIPSCHPRRPDRFATHVRRQPTEVLVGDSGDSSSDVSDGNRHSESSDDGSGNDQSVPPYSATGPGRREPSRAPS